MSAPVRGCVRVFSRALGARGALVRNVRQVRRSWGIMIAMPLVDAVEQYFAEHPDGIVAAYVFGSVARGEARPNSDVDVAVLLAQDPAATLEGLRTDLAEALERRLGRDVDLVVLNRAPADLVHRVLRDGRLVLETDRAARVRFEVRRRGEYFDLLPVLEEYRRGRTTRA